MKNWWHKTEYSSISKSYCTINCMQSPRHRIHNTSTAIGQNWSVQKKIHDLAEKFQESYLQDLCTVVWLSARMTQWVTKIQCCKSLDTQKNCYPELKRLGTVSTFFECPLFSTYFAWCTCLRQYSVIPIGGHQARLSGMTIWNLK